MLETMIMVNCLNDACKNIMRHANEFDGFESAFMVDKRHSSIDANLVINIGAESRDQVMEVKDRILNMDGVSSIKYWITE